MASFHRAEDVWNRWFEMNTSGGSSRSRRSAWTIRSASASCPARTRSASRSSMRSSASRCLPLIGS
eukprot:9324337-Alexandrium_andersonii.AAC.1